MVEYFYFTMTLEEKLEELRIQVMRDHPTVNFMYVNGIWMAKRGSEKLMQVEALRVGLPMFKTVERFEIIGDTIHIFTSNRRQSHACQ